jgi:hypothetical protein
VNVSSNIAPSTATVSVTSNKLFALAYQGFHFFKPLEVFQQETSNAVMAAMLIHDIRNPKARHVRHARRARHVTSGGMAWHGGFGGAAATARCRLGLMDGSMKRNHASERSIKASLSLTSLLPSPPTLQTHQVPSNPKNKLRNPLELFTYGSLHGGIWRMAFKVRPSIPSISACLPACLNTHTHAWLGTGILI